MEKNWLISPNKHIWLCSLSTVTSGRMWMNFTRMQSNKWKLKLWCISINIRKLCENELHYLSDFLRVLKGFSLSWCPVSHLSGEEFGNHAAFKDFICAHLLRLYQGCLCSRSGNLLSFEYLPSSSLNPELKRSSIRTPRGVEWWIKPTDCTSHLRPPTQILLNFPRSQMFRGPCGVNTKTNVA